MLTPIEVENTTFKTSATGYNKSQVEAFKSQITKDYETLFKKNMAMEDTIAGLNERLGYYTSIEQSLHKALVLAEKSAEETKRNAENNAKVIEKEAQLQARMILSDARKELFRLHEQTMTLLTQYETFKSKFSSLLDTEKSLLNKEPFTVDIKQFEAYTKYLQDSVDQTTKAAEKLG